VTYGQVPGTVNEVYYKTVANVLLTIITCGIWFGVYAYRTHGDLSGTTARAWASWPACCSASSSTPS
jgi:hypothetical protein